MVSTFEVQLPAYSIQDKIYTGTRTLVYRGIRKQDRKPVAIKLMRLEYPSFHELLQFRNQYVIAKNLGIPGVIQPYSLENYHNGYALVMEDFGGISLKEWGIEQKNTQFIANFLQVAITIADILHQLHSDGCDGLRLGVIHKDIKPANILINPETKQVKLIDFSIASFLPREVQEIQSFNVLEGTLAYLSPEQTGRMNRGVDYRTDFYSLGVTFYEILTGQLPFYSDDPIELIHAHLAKQATPPHQINPAIPQTISQIITKLMAKNAESRYQSALGLKYDLETCLHSLQETGEISDFEIGKKDIQNHFLIPEKLYGREQEVQILLDAFERVANGASELMLVAGFSGIGKTAVVNEVHKPIVKQRGYFIKGKFDQFNRNIPFSAFVQAFRNLMGQLLTEPDAIIQEWKTKIIAALGENGQVIIEVIPELKLIIGQQPPAPDLSGSAAQNRFNLLLQQFIQVFTTKEHPLVLFLDDLQWADSASLKLIELLIGNTNNGYLLLIGAYRDNEVTLTHPLMLTLEKITQANATINTIILQNLSYLKLNQLVADTLSCVEELAWTLSQLIYQKTQGNPFFATQFLKALHQEGLIEFNVLEGCWQCDITQINQQALTDDVVEFMAFQLRKLPQSTQQVLKLAACIGNQFDLKILATVSEKSDIETATCLWNALHESLILPQSNVYKFYVGEVNQVVSQESSEIVAYKFLHDRVQQAAYSLIPESHKKSTHLKIGQLLLQNTSNEALEASIFEIVSQLNQGIDIVTQQSEKYDLARLNLIAGRKAKASTAYKAAVKYLTSGIELLLENSWQTHYTLTFGLYRELAECEYLTGNLNQAEKLFDLALIHAQNQFEQADIYAIQMYLKMTQGENIQAACEAGLQGLSVMGMQLPIAIAEQQAAIKTELEELNTKLAKIQPADLFNLAEMTDPVRKVCISLLADLWAATYMAGHQHLAGLSSLLMINLSLKYGNAQASGFAYCLYGMSLANQGDYQTAYEFGTLAQKLDRHFNSTKFIYKTNNIFAHTINPYNRHLKTNLAVSEQSFQTSREAGDVVFGVWAVSFLIWAMLVKGDRLPDIYAETEKYLAYVQQVNDVNMLYAFTLQRQFLLNLQDSSQKTDLLSHQDEEVPYIDVWRQKQNFEHGINWYCFLKLQLAYIYGRYADGVAAALEAEKTLPANAGFFPIIQYHFYYPLCLAALYVTATSEEKQQYWQLIQEHQQIIKQWADNCSENFQHRYLLLSAEMLKISGKGIEAIDLYDRAIAFAKANEYIQEEAIANELAAKFYLEWGKEKVAAGYMQEAYYCYARWGALAKTQDLENRYPNLLRPILHQVAQSLNPLETLAAIVASNTTIQTSTISCTSSTSINAAIDFATILKASQAISSTIELDELLHQLSQIILKHSGSDRCALILPDSYGKWHLRAIATPEITELCSQPLEGNSNLPIKLIQYVKNTKEIVIIDNLKSDLPVIDEYLTQRQPQSVMCLPILNQGYLIGILYLKNYSTSGVFTSDRVLILNFLCTQAAISLENARLHALEREKSYHLEQSQTRLQLIIQRTPVAVMEWNNCFEFQAWNPAAEKVFGYREEEVLGRHFRCIIPEEYHVYVDDVAAQILAQTGGSHAINENLTKDGQRIICEWFNAPIFNSNGEICGGVSMALDISDRKHAEAAVQQKSQELEKALQNLQQAQLQIVQSEKMSALGNLVAGVAHEINNPVGFINGNIQPAYEGIQDLFNLLDLYQNKFTEPGEEIEEEIENIDLEYLREDLPKLIFSMKEGVQRIREISNSLRTFSRADSEYKVPFNIHDGLDSTILILKHRLKANENRPAIEVIKNYGNLPPIECFPGQLNQVFMNLLANAIDALEDANVGRCFAEMQAHPNIISITTQLSEDGKQVNISIKDNGIGMTKEIKDKVFDHLYTTKMVGKGTGLGLAIARQIIVEKHGGTLKANSAPNQGAEFVITLPM
ncbi:ATP-binding sensor histidine kinase [Calothrix sp. NIES-2098]|uniref:ATP-binding sensor histidine kinase n=1 Tax=Calothrix sp. NIES-2098 TaxID=1954171 RepID=UPI000B5F797A|nr:serine/threonine protein kinase with two-component sensor domain [Calothrix sp. NIES-2098]